MFERLHTRTTGFEPHWSTEHPPSGFLQRKCQCGQHTIGGGSCAACRKSASGGSRDHEERYLNGPAPLTPSPQRPQASCPASVKISRLDQANDRDFGKDGPMTGWGGFAAMDVTDSSGRDWRGTQIHETVRRIKNTCGDEGTKACSNVSGQGGGGGSSFQVGAASNFLGFIPLPGAANKFYDLHAYMNRGISVLHVLGQTSCEVQCEQFYTCGGRRFGPDFVITYSMTRASVPRSAGGFNAVTRVSVSKAEKTAASTTTP